MQYHMQYHDAAEGDDDDYDSDSDYDDDDLLQDMWEHDKKDRNKATNMINAGLVKHGEGKYELVAEQAYFRTLVCYIMCNIHMVFGVRYRELNHLLHTFYLHQQDASRGGGSSLLHRWHQRL